MKVDVIVIATRDIYENEDSAVIGDWSECIQICGMVDRDGKSAFFDTDAYHLRRWCENRGIDMHVKESVVEICE